jgi:hypothetical protein
MDGFLMGAAAMLHAAFDMREGARQIQRYSAATVDGAEATTRELRQVAVSTDELASGIGAIRKQVHGVAGLVEQALRGSAEGDGAGRPRAPEQVSEMVRLLGEISETTDRQAATMRAIAARMNAAAAETEATTEAMRQLLAISGTTDTKSATALQAANEIGRLADALYSKVSVMLPAAPAGDTTNQRIHERLRALGFQATLRVPGADEVRARIVDISRGGLALALRSAHPVGTEVEIDLPSGGTVRARVARLADGVTGFAVPQNPETDAQIERALHLLILSGAGQAA